MPLDSIGEVGLTDPEVREVLLGAALLVERGWCRFYPAKTVFGFKTNPLSPIATRFCVSGAIARAAWTHSKKNQLCFFRLLSDAREAVAGSSLLNNESIEDWNDYYADAATVSAVLREMA